MSLWHAMEWSFFGLVLSFAAAVLLGVWGRRS